MANKNLHTLPVCLLLAGCDLIDYHPYDVRISRGADVNAHNIEQVEAKCKRKTTIRFITMGDPQRWYDETKDFVKEINKRDDINFVIHGGDVSDFGLTKEFLWQRDIMNGLKVPYAVLIGNHDYLSTGVETYQTVFGPANFSFITGNVKFVYLNTNVLRYDYPEPVPNFGLMKQGLMDRADEFEETVVNMHTHPLADVFNDSMTKSFRYYITQYPELQFYTTAHNHGFDDRILFDDDVHYIANGRMKSHSYLVFAITPEKYEYGLVEY